MKAIVWTRYGPPDGLRLMEVTKQGQSYDVIFDVAGKSTYSRCIRSLKKNGRYLLANPTFSKMIRGLWTSKTSTRTVVFKVSNPKTEDLISLKELIEAGTIKVVIDRRYPLEQMVEVHKYVETGQKKGNVVITVGHH